MTSDEYLNVIKNTSRMGREAGVPLTDTHKAFLVRLIEYLDGNHQNEDFTFALSLDGMVEALGVPKRTVVESVDRLTSAGVLIREPDTGRRHGKGLNPMITTINREVFS